MAKKSKYINTDHVSVGSKCIEIEDGITETVLEKTFTSLLVSRTKRKAEGINCTNWFTVDDFEEQFKRL